MNLTDRVLSLCAPNWEMKHPWDTQCVQLSPDDSNYRNLQDAFVMRECTINKIVRVENPYLYGQYLLKLREMQAVNPGTREMNLYHDTKQSLIPSIIETNLDWRVVQRCKFGRGVSFASNMVYANQEANKRNGVQRAMIRAKVIVGCTESGCSDQHLPSGEADTTTGGRGQVYVKYYDFEFYPEFVVYYSDNGPHERRYRHHDDFWF